MVLNNFLTPQQHSVLRGHREVLHGHKGLVIWITGLSGSGKSTLANALEERMHRLGMTTFVLDGDNVRHGLCSDLGFSEQDRAENIRRVGEVSKLFLQAGMITIVAFISPYQKDREKVRALFEPKDFIEVYCDCDITVCEERDVKGLYRKARQGEISNFTGIDSPYEPPTKPEIILATGVEALQSCITSVFDYLESNNMFLKNQGK